MRDTTPGPSRLRGAPYTIPSSRLPRAPRQLVQHTPPPSDQPPQPQPQPQPEPQGPPPDPRVTIPYYGFPHIVEQIHNECDRQTQHVFSGLSKQWLIRGDRRCGTHYIVAAASPLVLKQRCGYVGIRRGRDCIKTARDIQSLASEFERQELLPLKWRLPVMDFVAQPAIQDKYLLARLRPKTIRLIGSPYRRLNTSWTWVHPQKCIIFCSSGIAESTRRLALSPLVDEIVVYLDDWTRGPPEISNYRRMNRRRVVFIFPTLHVDLSISYLNRLARVLASYPGKSFNPTKHFHLGKYTLVNVPGIHQRKSLLGGGNRALSAEAIKTKLFEKVDSYRQEDGYFPCSNRWQTLGFILEAPIAHQGIVDFLSKEEYQQGLKGGQWEEETVARW